MEGDGESNYAHYALHKLNILPSALTGLSDRERAFIYASIDIKVDSEKKALQKSKNKGRR